MEIVTYPAKILKQKAKPVSSVSADVIAAMETTMEQHGGIGLAAPQIGRSERIALVQEHAFLNPKIVRKSKEKEVGEEGCLSLPGLYVQIKRSKEVEVVAQTPDGKEVRIAAEGLAARVFQHEVDHLDGKLIIDRIPLWKRFSIKRSLKLKGKTSSSQS